MRIIHYSIHKERKEKKRYDSLFHLIAIYVPLRTKSVEDRAINKSIKQSIFPAANQLDNQSHTQSTHVSQSKNLSISQKTTLIDQPNINHPLMQSYRQ